MAINIVNAKPAWVIFLIVSTVRDSCLKCLGPVPFGLLLGRSVHRSPLYGGIGGGAVTGCERQGGEGSAIGC